MFTITEYRKQLFYIILNEYQIKFLRNSFTLNHNLCFAEDNESFISVTNLLNGE